MRSWLAARGVLAVALAVLTIVATLPQLPPVAMAQEPAPFVLPDEAGLTTDGALAVHDEPPPIEELPAPDAVRDEAAAQADLLPPAEWDIAALAAALEHDPEQAFRFIRDRIAFDPYAGVLRGARGTLAARAGNAPDRALLLAALLDAMGVEHRFALAELDDANIDRVIARASSPPAEALPAPGIGITGLDAEAIGTRASRDYARLREALGDRVETIGGAEPADPRDAVRSHAWVQAAFGPDWRDLDPTLPDAEAGTVLVPATETAAALPEDALHAVTIRVTAETVTGTSLAESVVLEHVMSAPAAAASDVFVTFVPYDPDLGTVITQALSGQDEWAPVLVVETDVTTGQPFAVSGRGTDVFGDPTAPVELATLRLEIERRAPDGSTTTAERMIVDRLGDPPSAPAAADALTPMQGDEAGPFALTQIHHVLISTGGIDRREYAIERSASADFVAISLDSELPIEAFDLPSILWPIAVADQALVVASEAAIVPALEADGRFRAYIAEPRVTIMSVGRDAADGDVGYATDLLIDGVRLLPIGAPGPGEAARRQLWYGALQTALETEIAIRRAALLDPAERMVSGVSLTGGDPLSVLAGTDATSLPPGVPTALRSALEGGAFVVVPGDVADASAWWTVDASTGATRSILDPGLGGAVPRGPVGPGLRVLDSSYTHGKGPRLPPRPRAVRPPGGSTYSSPRSAPVTGTCGPSDSTGYIPTIGCVSIPAVASWVLLAVGISSLAAVWYLILTT